MVVVCAFRLSALIIYKTCESRYIRWRFYSMCYRHAVVAPVTEPVPTIARKIYARTSIETKRDPLFPVSRACFRAAGWPIIWSIIYNLPAICGVVYGIREPLANSWATKTKVRFIRTLYIFTRTRSRIILRFFVPIFLIAPVSDSLEPVSPLEFFFNRYFRFFFSARTFGIRRRLQMFLFLPISFKLGVILTLLLVLTAISAKTLFLGFVILLLLAHNMHYGHSKWLGVSRSPGLHYEPPHKSVHIHVHNVIPESHSPLYYRQDSWHDSSQPLTNDVQYEHA